MMKLKEKEKEKDMEETTMEIFPISECNMHTTKKSMDEASVLFTGLGKCPANKQPASCGQTASRPTIRGL